MCFIFFQNKILTIYFDVVIAIICNASMQRLFYSCIGLLWANTNNKEWCL